MCAFEQLCTAHTKMNRSWKHPIWCKDLRYISYVSRVLTIMSQILLPWQRKSLGEKFAWHHSMAYPRKPPYRCKNFADISHKPSYSQFCPKFRCHGNEGRSGKNSVGSIRWPIAENPTIDANILQISLTQTELEWILSQNSLPWQRELAAEKF